MKQRFTKEELYLLRNELPMEWIIGSILQLPSKVNEGIYRFLCPICGEFNTATNRKTNLARCFSCQRNFNTIEIVMLCRKVGFVESVNFLKRCGYQLKAGAQHFTPGENKRDIGIGHGIQSINEVLRRIALSLAERADQ